MLPALLQLLESLDIDVLTSAGYFSFEIDPSAVKPRPFQLAISNHFELFLHEYAGGSNELIFFDDVFFFVGVGAVRCDD